VNWNNSAVLVWYVRLCGAAAGVASLSELLRNSVEGQSVAVDSGEIRFQAEVVEWGQTVSADRDDGCTASSVLSGLPMLDRHSMTQDAAWTAVADVQGMAQPAFADVYNVFKVFMLQLISYNCKQFMGLSSSACGELCWPTLYALR